MQQYSMKVFFITANNAVVNPNWKLTLKAMQKCSINVLFITVTNVVINEKQKDISNNMYQRSMKVFFITATNVVINSNGKLMLKTMQKCSMKVSFITVTNVIIEKQDQGSIAPSTSTILRFILTFYHYSLHTYLLQWLSAYITVLLYHMFTYISLLSLYPIYIIVNFRCL